MLETASKADILKAMNKYAKEKRTGNFVIQLGFYAQAAKVSNRKIADTLGITIDSLKWKLVGASALSMDEFEKILELLGLEYKLERL